MAELFVSIALYALQEIRHECGLLLHNLLLKSLELLAFLLVLRQLLKLFKLVGQILEVGCPVVILRREMLLFHRPVLGQFL